jgi:pimeloyl-ACP methyl ester carboxylesterase
VFDVADALGWDAFVLIGHSMGAAVATMAAGAVPERIQKVRAGAVGAAAIERAALERTAGERAESVRSCSRTARVD